MTTDPYSVPESCPCSACLLRPGALLRPAELLLCGGLRVQDARRAVVGRSGAHRPSRCPLACDAAARCRLPGVGHAELLRVDRARRRARRLRARLHARGAGRRLLVGHGGDRGGGSRRQSSGHALHPTPHSRVLARATCSTTRVHAAGWPAAARRCCPGCARRWRGCAPPNDRLRSRPSKMPGSRRFSTKLSTTRAQESEAVEYDSSVTARFEGVLVARALGGRRGRIPLVLASLLYLALRRRLRIPAPSDRLDEATEIEIPRPPSMSR